jgi:hypothetical protein
MTGISSYRDVTLGCEAVRIDRDPVADEAASVGDDSQCFLLRCTPYRQSPDANSLFFDDDDAALLQGLLNHRQSPQQQSQLNCRTVGATPKQDDQRLLFIAQS